MQAQAITTGATPALENRRHIKVTLEAIPAQLFDRRPAAPDPGDQPQARFVPPFRDFRSVNILRA
jgi:hypothetical protein